MSGSRSLHGYLHDAALRWPERTAVVDPVSHREVTYRELDEWSDRIGSRLRDLGVAPGDRVGIYLRKSVEAVASIFATLKRGAAYVPVDPGAPTARCAYALANCSAAAVVLAGDDLDGLRAALEPAGRPPALLAIEACDAEGRGSSPVAVAPDDLAYLLYTSGSTGRPKGVMLSHRNATSFVDWCSDVFEPRESDRFSSHAPFHFDLSILDLFLPIKHGATLFLIGEELGKNPGGMAALIEERRLTSWYSTPSVLSLLVEYGKLESRDASSLRTVLFAGEVFPVKHLRRLKELVPAPRYFNLYGPTETNVCTWYEIPGAVPVERTTPYPIGRVCSHMQARVVADGSDVSPGHEGELLISGEGVMRGYWKEPERNASAFQDDAGGRWYRTGDLVVESEPGLYTLVGRRDRMVKRRGFRIELGEIEAVLHAHPDVSEAAAVAVSNDEGVQIRAFYSTPNGRPLSLIQLKQFCGERVPSYMIPDRFVQQERLPKTSTDKIDYQRLIEIG